MSDVASRCSNPSSYAVDREGTPHQVSL